MNFSEFKDLVKKSDINNLDKEKIQKVLDEVIIKYPELETITIDRRNEKDNPAYIFMPENHLNDYDKNLITIWLPKTQRGKARYVSYSNYVPKQYFRNEETNSTLKKISASYIELKNSKCRI